MSILSRAAKFIIKSVAVALLKDASKLETKAEKATKKLASIDKKYIAKRKADKAKSEKYRLRAINTHGEQSAAKHEVRVKANEQKAKALQAKKQAETLQALLK